MRSPVFIWLFLPLVFSLFSCSSPPAKRGPVVAIVSISHNFDPFVNGFQAGLRSLGYQPGENISYLYDGPIAESELEQHLTSLKERDIDLLYTLTTPVTRAAKRVFANSGVPIVFAPVFSPVEAGVVESLIRPGVDITGVMSRGGTFTTLEYLCTIVPSIKTIFVPYHEKDLAAQLTMDDLQEAAACCKVEVVPALFDSVVELDTVLANIPEQADALWLTHSHLIVSNASRIIGAATRKGLPVASSSSQYRHGALLSYGVDPARMGEQAARMADKILTGLPAASLPVQQADYFLALNQETARRLGITIPLEILRRAAIIYSENP